MGLAIPTSLIIKWQICKHKLTMCKQVSEAYKEVQMQLRSKQTRLQQSLTILSPQEQNVDQATNGGAVSTTKQFIAGTGIFTPQHVGYYQICSYSRFQLGGNAVEMCVRKGGTRVACYGNAVQYDWISTGVCTIQSMALTDTISLYLESGGSSDCVQETGWLYNHISIKLIQPTAT